MLGRHSVDTLMANAALETVTPRILICDDNEMGRHLLRRMLTRRGYLVEEAIDGEEAIEAVERRPPDLVLLDLRLPDLDGSEVLEGALPEPACGQLNVRPGASPGGGTR
jgi:CheY-like chemotaxis protein